MRLSILCLTLICLVLNTFAEEVNYENRCIQQQKFVINYLKEYELMGKDMQTLKDVDQRIFNITQAWKENIKSDDPVLNRFDCYTMSIIGHTGGIEEWIDEYLFQKHKFQNFLDDIDFIETNISGIYLLNRPSIDNVLYDALKYDLTDQQWNKLHLGYVKILNIIDEQLEKSDSDDMTKQLKSVEKAFKEYQNEIEIQNYIYAGKPEEAYKLISEAFNQNSMTRKGLIRPTKLMAFKFNEKDMKEEALSSLDFLTKYTINGELSRETLKEWYQIVDKENGLKRYNETLEKSDIEILRVSKKHMDLSGEYLNLSDNQLMDISKLKGKMILIDFWTTNCYFCDEEIPDLNRFNKEYSNLENFVFISVVGDAVKGGATKEKILEHIENNGIEYIVLYDKPEKSLEKQFRIYGHPRKYMLDENGYVLIRNKGVGYISLEAAEEYLQTKFDK